MFSTYSCVFAVVHTLLKLCLLRHVALFKFERNLAGEIYRLPLKAKQMNIRISFVMLSQDSKMPVTLTSNVSNATYLITARHSKTTGFPKIPNANKYILSRFVSFTRVCLLGCIDC